MVISFALNNLVSFKIDAEKDYGVELVKKYNVSAYPTIVFLDDKGGEIDRIVGYLSPDKFLKELKRIHNGSNTLPALLLDLQLNPTKFSTLFRLIKKYENMNEKELAKEMIDTILSADTDSAGTAAFLSLLYDAREAQNSEPLIKYADQNPDNENTEKVLQEAMAILRRKGDNPELEAGLYLRYIYSVTEPTPNTFNSFAWRMSELEMHLDIALEKVTWGIERTSDLNQKYMFIDTKAEVLWKMGLISEALMEIEKCVKGKPEDKYYREQKEKFQHSMKKGNPTSL